MSARGVATRVLTGDQLTTLLGVILTFQGVPFEKRRLQTDEAARLESLSEKLLEVRRPIYGGVSPGVASTPFSREELAVLVEVLADCIAAFRDDEVGIRLHLWAERIEEVTELHAIASDALAEASNAPGDFA